MEKAPGALSAEDIFLRLPIPYTSLMTATPMVPVSWGELLDKITILQIKQERLRDDAKRINVTVELTALTAVAGTGMAQAAALLAALKKVNEALWDIEDRIRDKERDAAFDAEFIALARAVYVTNDKRADLKRDINRLLGSALMEEKSYSPYTQGPAGASQ